MLLLLLVGALCGSGCQGRVAVDEILARVFDTGRAEFVPIFPASPLSAPARQSTVFLRALEQTGRPGHLPAAESTSRNPHQLFRDNFASRADILSVLHRSQALANNGTFLGGKLRQHEDFNLVKLTRSKKDGELWSGALPLPDDAVLDANLADKSLRHGFTLLLNKANHRLAPLLTLSASMEDLYGECVGMLMAPRCNINVYVTDRGGQGFEPHFDWMDVIVLQVKGAKTWTLYAPSPSDSEWELRRPRSDQKFKPSGVFLEKLVKHEVRMRQGDILFLPAGVIHKAKCGDEDSMHLSLGIEIDEEFTWAGLLHFAIRSSSAVQKERHTGRTHRNDVRMRMPIGMLLHAAVIRASRKDNCLRNTPRSSQDAGEVAAGVVAYPCGDASGMLSGDALSIESILEYLADGNAVRIVAKVALASGATEEEVSSVLTHRSVAESFHGNVEEDGPNASSEELRVIMKEVLSTESLDVGAAAMIEAHRVRRNAWRENRAANVARHQQKVPEATRKAGEL